MEDSIIDYDTTLQGNNCRRCYNTGVVSYEAYPGAHLFKACSCPIALENRLKAEQELKEMLARCNLMTG